MLECGNLSFIPSFNQFEYALQVANITKILEALKNLENVKHEDIHFRYNEFKINDYQNYLWYIKDPGVKATVEREIEKLNEVMLPKVPLVTIQSYLTEAISKFERIIKNHAETAKGNCDD